MTNGSLAMSRSPSVLFVVCTKWLGGKSKATSKKTFRKPAFVVDARIFLGICSTLIEGVTEFQFVNLPSLPTGEFCVNSHIEELERSSPAASSDRLEAVRSAVRARRDLGREIAELEERLDALSKRRHRLDAEVLPGMFLEIGVDRIGLPAEGNEPAVDAVLSNLYNASIPAAWDAERREKAFAKLSELGLGALVRRVVESDFGPGEEGWKRVVDALEKLGVSFSVKDTVHWKTLTAAIQSLCEAGRTPSAPDLEAVGAFVGKIVKLKPRE